MKYSLFILNLLLLFAYSCGNVQNNTEVSPPNTTKKSQAQQIIDNARTAHGSDKVSHGDITFTFRDRTYKGMRDGGVFQYERIFKDSAENNIRDVLSNSDFFREINGEKTNLPEDRIKAFSNSVNSVLYCILLCCLTI